MRQAEANGDHPAAPAAGQSLAARAADARPRGRVEAVELDLGSHSHADLGFAQQYWELKRRGRLAPSRADIDPAEIVPILPRVMLADVLRDPLDFRYRLSGTGIATVHGEDLTHLSPRQLKPSAYGELIWSHYAETVERKTPILHLVTLDTEEASQSYARLLLPLSEDGQRVTMLMAVHSHEQNSRALREFFAKVKAEG